MNKLISPLAKARGLGSSHKGSAHFNTQKFLAVLLVPLVSWFIYSVGGLMLFGDYESSKAYFSDVCAVTLTVALLVAMFYHAALGLQNIFEDYIHCETTKTLAIYTIKILCILIATSGIIAVLSIYLKG